MPFAICVLYSLFWYYFCVRLGIVRAAPNIIVYITDDQGFGEFYDNPLIDTPNMRQFVAQGMLLNRTYANTVCAPSRWEGLTGSNEVRGNGVDGIVSIPNVTLPKVLQARGYVTGIIGKYGHGDAKSISSATAMGFSYSYIYPTHVQAHTIFAPWLEENGKRILFNRNKYASRQRCMQRRSGCTYAPDQFLSKSLEFIDKNVHNNFFLWLAPNLPHVGLYRSRDKDMHSPVTTYGKYTDRKWGIDQRGHAAMITYYIDRDIGAVVDKLKALNIDSNTLVLFVSDNGAERYFDVIEKLNANGGLRGAKRDMYEGGVRVPGAVRWPGMITAGTSSNYPWKLQDLLPTLTKIAGSMQAKPGTVAVDQIWLKGDQVAKNMQRPFMHIKYCPSNKEPCLQARYDLQVWPRKVYKLLNNGAQDELFEVLNDPLEQQDLATDPKYAKYLLK